MSEGNGLPAQPIAIISLRQSDALLHPTVPDERDSAIGEDIAPVGEQ
ncbi:MAG: hypothetical protein ACMG6H_04570 [Acidobacteriota bacterium]